MGIAIPIAGIAAAVGSTVANIKANQDASDAKAREDADNQRLANDAAADARARGAQQAGRVRMEAGQLMAQQQVAFARSGVDATSGTPVELMASSRMMGELDARTIENNAAREAMGFQTYGLKFQQQAALDRQALGNRQVGTVLGGLGDVAAAASRFKQRGHDESPHL